MGRLATWGFYDTPVPVTASDTEKKTAPLYSAGSGDLTAANLDHELIRATHSFSDSAPGKPTWSEIEFYYWPTQTSLKKVRVEADFGETIDVMSAWIAHKLLSEMNKPGEYRIYWRAEGYDAQAVVFTMTESGEPPEPEVDLVFTRTNADPETFSVPSSVTFTTPLLNNGDAETAFDFELHIIKPDNSTIQISDLDDQSLYAHNTWDIITNINLNDLPDGSYGTLVGARNPATNEIYSQRTDTDVFTISASAPPTGDGVVLTGVTPSENNFANPNNINFTIGYNNFDETITADVNVFLINQATSAQLHILYPKSVSFINGNYRSLIYSTPLSQPEPGIYDILVEAVNPSNGVAIANYTNIGGLTIISAGPEDPEFTITNMSVTPNSIIMPDGITVKADVKNIGLETVEFLLALDLVAPGGGKTSIGVSSEYLITPGETLFTEKIHQYTDLVNGVYNIEVVAVQIGTGLTCGSALLVGAFEVTTEAPSFWETFLDNIGLTALINVLLGLTQPAFNALNTIFNVMTGADFVESDSDIIKDYLPGFVAWNVIQWGKMLNDESRSIPTETEMIYIIALGTVIVAAVPAWQALGSMIATGPAEGSAEAYLAKYFLTTTASSAPAAGSLEAILLGSTADAGVVATAASTTTLTTMGTVFGTVNYLHLMKWIAMGIIGADSIATWLASDNIVTGTTFPMNRLKDMVEAGTVTKEDALEEIATIQAWKTYATNFISISGIANPLMWLFRSLFMKNTELAQLNIDQIKAQIEGTGPTPAETGTLVVSSIPAGARVYIDDEFKYEYTDTTFLVEIGAHTITLKMQDFDDYSGNINMIQDTTTTFSANLSAVEPKMRLTIWSVPPNARIYIDDVFKYEYTNTTFSAPAGYHKLTLKKESYNDYTANYDYPEGSERAVEFDLAAGDGQITYPISEVEFELTPTVRTYNCWKVNISAKNIYSGEALNAWVLIDDIYQSGTTPLDVFLVAQSTYDIKLHLAGYREAQQIFTTEALP